MFYSNCAKNDLRRVSTSKKVPYIDASQNWTCKKKVENEIKKIAQKEHVAEYTTVENAYQLQQIYTTLIATAIHVYVLLHEKKQNELVYLGNS